MSPQSGPTCWQVTWTLRQKEGWYDRGTTGAGVARKVMTNPFRSASPRVPAWVGLPLWDQRSSPRAA
eukprot:7294939-Lingulodinium_polyedra.AAC.1